MTPLRPLPSKSAQPTKSILKRKDGINSAVTKSDPLFATSKKDRRRIKHAHLMSKVTKPSSAKARRRRPNKKLVTTLNSLAEALPDSEGPDGVQERGANAAGVKTSDQVNIIQRKSMKSRPGAMKRKQKLDNSERDRFAKNLAQISASNSTGTTAADKLRALRGFIAETLEKRPEVVAAGE